MDPPLLVVSTPRSRYLSLDSIRVMLEEGVSGINAVDTNEAQLNGICGTVEAFNAGSRAGSFVMTNDSAPLFYNGHYPSTPITYSIATLDEETYSNALTFSALMGKRWSGSKFKTSVPTLSSTAHANLFARSLPALPYMFADIGAIGSNTREAECGRPMGLEGLEDVLRAIPPGVPFIVSGGIRSSDEVSAHRYSISQIYEAIDAMDLGYRPNIVGVMVGSPISGKPVSAVSGQVRKYMGELMSAHASYHGI